MRFKKIFFIAAFCTASLAVAAQQSFTMDLYSGRPTVKGTDKNDTARVYVYLPDASRSTGRAVLILPGGAYEWLSMENEGSGFAEYFNNLGIAAVVLKYRMPHGKPLVPISDAEEAMRLIRRSAQQWHINPSDVGVLGSSAGGHLAATLSTLAKDDVRPNFQILFYPLLTMMPEKTHMGAHDSFLGKKAKKKDERLYSPVMQVSRHTPRALIFFGEKDDLVPTWNGTDYYLELYRHDVPASIFIYPGVGHGFGSTKNGAVNMSKFADMRSWLQSF
ncbi:MAG: alpha/beta hydrolase [Prevotella sp.]|nr:alpha/beta hydrolase [Prevotella sp.]